MKTIELNDDDWARLKRKLMNGSVDDALKDYTPPVKLTAYFRIAPPSRSWREPAHGACRAVRRWFSMIQKFVDAWMKNRDLIQSWLEPICLGCDYSAIVKATVRAIALEATGDYGDPKPDFDNIHEINDGDYQGTLVYVIPEAGYQPSEYWYVRVSYGSCCCCDTLQGEQMGSKEDCIKGVMALSLHIVQQMRKMGGDEV